MYLLTTTAAGFFERRGYVAAARESAPAEIRATREFADICPASSAFMVKHL
jgi:N-acetylglutamate synthase-like GNAT family acetyltransferase